MAEYTIGEVARRLGMRTSALRYYETAGIVPAARRLNGRRLYGDELVDAIAVARFAQSVGFTLAEIKRLCAASSRRSSLDAQWRPLARAKLDELDGIIKAARSMRAAIASGLECGCIRFTDCLPARGSKPTKAPAAPRRKPSASR